MRRRRKLVARPVFAAAALLCALITGCAGGTSSVRRDGPPDGPVPADIAAIPDAEWRAEPLSKFGNPISYKVDGATYYVSRERKAYKARGYASWYGKQFHGERTSSGESYDMYKMTAAHKTLPIPSFVRVTNLENGRKVILRVNDRGPFHDDRVIDVSYVAASKLGMLRKGTAYVEVEALLGPSSPAQDTPQIAQAETTSATATLESAAEPLDQDTALQTQPLDGAPSPTVIEVRQTTSAVSLPDELPADDSATQETASFRRVSLPAPEPELEAEPEPQAAFEDAVTPPRGGVFLQAGAFRYRLNADQLEARLKAEGLYRTFVLSSMDDGLYRVRLGPYADEDQVAEDRARLEDLGLAPRTVRE